MVIKKHIVPLFFLVVLGLFAMKTLKGPDFYDGHDAQAHIVRLHQYDQAFKDGQILPHWAGGLLGKRGYPVFLFTYPLPYLIAEGFHQFGLNFSQSLKITFVCAYLLSTMFMYLFAYNYWQSRRAGFLSALIWSWAPFIFVKIFITASLGVVVSYVFLPLVFLFLHRLINKPNLKNSLYLSLSLTGWILSHMLVPIVFSPLLVTFLLVHLIKSKDKKEIIKFLIVSIFFCLGLSCFYLLPAIYELKFTHYHQFVKYQYAFQFVSLKRLIYSKWGTGAPGWSNNPLSQQVGITQWLSILLAGLSFFFLKNRKGKKDNWKLVPFVLSFFISIFLMLKISEPIWNLPTPLKNVSTPWRFLSLSVFTAAVSVGYLVKKLKKYPGLLFVTYSLIIILAIYSNRNHLRINEIKHYSQQFLEDYTGVATGWNEHLPIWIKKADFEPPEEKLAVIEGNCIVNESVPKSNLQSFQVKCSDPSTLQLNTAYYPGWNLSLDNKDITNEMKDGLSQANGMMRFETPVGDHQVEAVFTDTWWRILSKIISGITLSGVLLWLISGKK